VSEPLRVLLVEDNPGDADLITELLSDDDRIAFDLDHADRLTKALQILEQGQVDIILLDLGLPDSAGLDTLHVLRQKTPDLPIVVLTGNSDGSTALAAIQAGAQDYLVKGQVTGALLSTVLLYAIERNQGARRLRESEEQLHQSQKMDAVGQLAGGIAHDFNNLLTAIIGYSELMLFDPEFADTAWCHDVTQIRAAADRASALTRQILAFSRHQALRPRVVSLNDVLAGVEPLLRRTLGENVELAILRQPDLGHAEVDVHQFEQVLMNLAINARDAMASGGRLTIETRDVDLDDEYCRIHSEVDAGPYVMLAVSDTGVGMDETTRRRVFEPFFTTKDLGEGTGLGLATVQGIVKASLSAASLARAPSSGSICPA
jgi:two-component system cell cycle sensor histidine kinase/response regulator CckA